MKCLTIFTESIMFQMYPTVRSPIPQGDEGNLVNNIFVD